MTEPVSRNRFAFPESRRLTRSAEFERVKRDGKVERGILILLSVLETNEPVPFRAAFITARTLGSTVTRNRVRRRLREVVRKHQHEIVNGTWIVMIARTSAARASYQELEGEWLRLAKRASILAA